MWVDGAPRVACVTPVRRIAGREVTTVEGLSAEQCDRWVAAFVARGASQCGFCTPGIVMRLAALDGAASGGPPSRRDVEAGLRAHLCRCTGWQSIVEAACDALGIGATPAAAAPGSATPCSPPGGPRSRALPSRSPGPTSSSVAVASRTTPHRPARWSSSVPMRRSPPTCAPPAADHGRIQGRNSTVPLTHPVGLPAGEWALTLQTTWVEPAYVEPDASWSLPGGRPAPPLANGGAFGGKRRSPVPARARELSDEMGEAVRVLWRREDVVRRGPKRPPLAIALRPDGTGILRVASTQGSADLGPLTARVHESCPGVHVEQVEVAGPPVAPELRGAGWAEALAARSALEAPAAAPGTGRARVVLPGVGSANVEVHLGAGERGRVEVDVWAGEILCRTTLRSYALGAVHQALGMVWSEGIAVDDGGRAGRPDHPLLRHPGRPRHARGRRAAPRRGALARQRLRRRVRRHLGRGLDRRRSSRPLAHPAHHRAGAVARRGTIGRLR